MSWSDKWSDVGEDLRNNSLLSTQEEDDQKHKNQQHSKQVGRSVDYLA